MDSVDGEILRFAQNDIAEQFFSNLLGERGNPTHDPWCELTSLTRISHHAGRLPEGRGFGVCVRTRLRAL